MSKLIDLNDIDGDDELYNQIFEYLQELEGQLHVKDKFVKVSSKVLPSSLDDDSHIIEEEYVLEEELTPKKLFFNTEFDSHQSKFEMLSNQLKICTTARSDIVGTVLLFYLGLVIDRSSSIIVILMDMCNDQYPDGIEYN